MSDQTTVFLAPQLCAHIPANLPAAILLSWLRGRRATHFTARPLPPCFRLAIGFNKHTGQRSGASLPMKGWAIFATSGRNPATSEVVMLGLAEEDAKTRAAALNTRQAASGFHSRN